MLPKSVNVGDIVYPAYSPVSVGVVLRTGVSHEIKAPHGKIMKLSDSCEVRFKKGTRVVALCELRSLEDLIADHEKKLQSHIDRLADFRTWLKNNPEPPDQPV